MKSAHSIRLRKFDSYIIGDMHVMVNSAMTVNEATEIADEIKKVIKEFDSIIEMNVL